MKSLQNGSSRTVTIITLVVITVFLIFAFNLLPRGFSDDLSLIGNGSNVVVLTNKKDSVQSYDLITLLNRIRSDYEDRVEFVVTDVDTPDGKAFADRQRVSGSVLLFFSPDGTRLDAVINISGEEQLRDILDKTFR